MSTRLSALGQTTRAFVFVALASLGLGGCCGGPAENKGPSFRAPASEKAQEKPTATPAEPASPTASASAAPAPTFDPPSNVDRQLGLARRLGKLKVDPAGPKFASTSALSAHYRKHGAAMGFADENEYLAAAQTMIARNDVERFQRKADQLFFRSATGEFAVLSGRNAIRTYFVPNDPPRYWQRQKDGQKPHDDEEEPRGRRTR